MKKSQEIFPVLILFLSIICPLYPVPCSLTYAEVPHLISYQGRLKDSNGKPLVDATYQVIYRIFNTASGGNPLWQGTYSVPTEKGVFNVLLGDTNDPGYDFSWLEFNQPYFLEIQVGSDEPMQPRQRITSVGYALKAQDTEKFNGQDSSYYRNASNINAGLLSVVQGGTGRTAVLSVSQVVGTTDIDAPASESDMDNMTTTFTTYGTKLLVLLSANFLGDQDKTVQVYINIDGINKHSVKTTCRNGYWGSQLTWLETGLTPGRHTVKIRWQVTSGGGAFRQLGSQTKRVLTCMDLD